MGTINNPGVSQPVILSAMTSAATSTLQNEANTTTGVVGKALGIEQQTNPQVITAQNGITHERTPLPQLPVQNWVKAMHTASSRDPFTGKPDIASHRSSTEMVDVFVDAKNAQQERINSTTSQSLPQTQIKPSSFRLKEKILGLLKQARRGIQQKFDSLYTAASNKFREIRKATNSNHTNKLTSKTTASSKKIDNDNSSSPLQKEPQSPLLQEYNLPRYQHDILHEIFAKPLAASDKIEKCLSECAKHNAKISPDTSKALLNPIEEAIKNQDTIISQVEKKNDSLRGIAQQLLGKFFTLKQALSDITAKTE